jgi:hypothetical protein
MLISALGFFMLAAVLGGYLLTRVLGNKKIPKAVAITHGLVAGAGLICLVLYPFYYHPAPMLSLILFAAAAMGGLTMLYLGKTGKSIPSWMALGHGTTAIIGLVTLVVFILI